jgi:GT2 family glycosyltransferase
MNDLDIGVIYTHERQWMPRLLDSLAGSSGNLKTRLILIDNASEGGVEPYARRFGTTRVIRNKRRLFYSANLNQILHAASARYTLLLNTDVYFDPEEQCVAQMASFMDSHPQCGMAGCRVYRPNGQYAYPARRFPTFPMVLARRLALEGLLRGTLDDYLYCGQDAAGTWPCDWIAGCFMLIRREAFQQVGDFDTRFVKYFEDVDYSLRMAQAGWQVVHHGATYCYHVESRSSRNLLSADAWRHLQSYLRWLRKWGVAPGRCAAPPDQLRPAA